MQQCNNCPRKCNAIRTSNDNFGGVCGMPTLPKLAKAGLHFWEEPCISGKNGSGTIFFSGCSLICVYCQNHIISHSGHGKIVTIERLAEIFKELELQGAHNINLVNPTHYFSAIEQALNIYRPNIPIVYNSGGYDLCENISKNIFDVFLMDFKYFHPETSLKYSKAENYTEFAKASIKAAYALCPKPIFCNDGLIKRGLIIRHLILPQHTNEAISIIDWCANNVPDAIISIMSQYVPMHDAQKFNEINRKITRREYDKILDFVIDRGIENVILQEHSSASEKFIPDFDCIGI